MSVTFPAAPFGAYVIANPGTNRVPKGGLYGYPNPIRRYKALELSYERRAPAGCAWMANYRFARLTGSYEGLFRNDNRQDDPNFTSLYDFPDSPMMSGQFIAGPLPVDASHVLHVLPSYRFASKLGLGANLSWSSGVPRTSLLAHPVYGSAGEIPGIDPIYAYWADPTSASGACSPPDCQLKTTADASQALSDPGAVSDAFLKSYTPVRRGNLGRTPSLVTLDLHADYACPAGRSTIHLFLDVFNVLQARRPTAYLDYVEFRTGVPHPDYQEPIAFQNPRTWRLGARWNF